ncbi:MAG: hypothetical protein ABUT20_18620 [Bacteroidota bacterium]
MMAVLMVIGDKSGEVPIAIWCDACLQVGRQRSRSSLKSWYTNLISYFST